MNLSEMRQLQQEIDAAGMGNPKDKRIKELEAQLAALEAAGDDVVSELQMTKKALAALEEAARWHYPPEEPTDKSYLVTIERSYRWGDDEKTERYTDISAWCHDRWAHDTEFHNANHRDYEIRRVVAWRERPEPYVPPSKEGAK